MRPGGCKDAHPLQGRVEEKGEPGSASIDLDSPHGQRPPLLACSISLESRSRSASLSFDPERSMSAIITFSTEPSKKVSSTRRSADRRATLRSAVGKYTLRRPRFTRLR